MSDVAARDADAAARRRAQTEFDRPLVLEAGAGTGKTAVLVARIVAWTLGVGWERAAAERAEQGDAVAQDPDRIARDVLDGVVAITFTEAAAAQMAMRTAEDLRAVERREPPEWIDLDVLPDEDVRVPRARALLRALDHLGARTIHAFCRRILAEHPLEAGVHPRFAVDADEREQRAIIREVMEHALPGLLEDPADLAVLLEKGHGPPELELALLDLLRLGVCAEDIADDPLAPPRIEGCLADLRARAGAFAERWSPHLIRAGGLAESVAGEVGRLANAVTGEPSIETLRAAIATLPDVGSKTGWIGRLADLAKGNLSNKGERTELVGEIDSLAPDARELRRAIHALGKLDPDLLTAAHRTIHPLLRNVEAELRTRGVATFASLLRGTRDLLVGQPQVGRRLRSRIRQVLVDEFQDTDSLQCEILERLVLDAPQEERPGLFLVGDPKQSIYGWRNADLAAYARFVRRVVEQEEPDRLTVNFRSVPAVLAEVQRSIAPVMLPAEGLQPEFQPLLVCEARQVDRGFEAGDHRPVEHWVTWSWDEAEGPRLPAAAGAVSIEAEAVAADILRVHRDHGVAWGDVALLFRSSGELGTYLDALRRAGVPFVVEGDRDYYRRREVLEAAALVRCIIDPSDVLALLAVLRSSMVGVPDAALLPLWQQRVPEIAADLYGEAEDSLDDLAAAVERAVADLPPDVDGLEAVAGWDANLVASLQDVAALRRSFAEDPADSFVERLRTRVLLEACEASRRPGIYRVANLDRFFRDLEISLEDGEGDPRAILRILRLEVAERREAEEGRPKEAVEDAVQVMTIHKAKGLDFDHVYVVQLHKGSGHARENRAEWSPSGTFEYQLFGATTPGYAEVESRAEEVAAAERVRTLYVAMTRARERLVVIGARELGGKSPSGESHAALLTSRAPEDLEERLRAVAAAGETGFTDADDVRWVAPGLHGFSEAGLVEETAQTSLFGEGDVEAGWRALVEERRTAAARMGRGYSAAVSAGAHEALRDAHRAVHEPPEGEGEPRPARDRPPLSRAAAMSVGTAVHRALERLDAGVDPTAEHAEVLAALEDELIRSLPEAERAAALARARELVERFLAGPLYTRLSEIAGGVVARELPVLLPPAVGDDQGPVGFLAGAVDLVYHDPASGALVVADYKTDRIGSPAELDEKVALYASQGAGYVRAVEQALRLPASPRFELWFLDADVVREV